ncbi:MAG: siphovirus Gp157 family protein [Rhodospirillales bacterium]|nr:siphovirus Gp157 family protein [Rhodospirillales bacterium]
MRLDPAFLAGLAAEIRSYLGDDDEAAFLDTLDGETDALDIADELIVRALEADALAEAARAQARDLSARAGRMDARSAAIRAQMLALIDAMGVRKLERPRATLSRRTGTVSVRIVDEAEVPTQLCRVERVPDKTAIKRALEAGENVPGAELGRGPDGVTLRVA